MSYESYPTCHHNLSHLRFRRLIGPHESVQQTRPQQVAGSSEVSGGSDEGIFPVAKIDSDSDSDSDMTWLFLMVERDSGGQCEKFRCRVWDPSPKFRCPQCSDHLGSHPNLPIDGPRPCHGTIPAHSCCHSCCHFRSVEPSVAMG